MLYFIKLLLIFFMLLNALFIVISHTLVFYMDVMFRN